MNNVLYSFGYSLDFLSDQVADVADVDMVVIPAGSTNHPAWAIGHLTFVLQMIGGVIGNPMSLDESWTARFGPGSTPAQDASVYESKKVALRILTEARERIVDTVSRLKDEELDQRFPDPEYIDVFPTIRHALTQVLVGHTAFHVGQVSAWRRAMGLSSMGRSYE